MIVDCGTQVTGIGAGTLFLFGGDTYNGNAQQREQGQVDLAWSNGYKNDVWSMTGTEWQVSHLEYCCAVID